jgi:hypothetical protein
LCAAAPAADPYELAYKAWTHALTQRCPQRQVELMGDGGYGEFIDAYYSTLQPQDQKRLSQVENLDRYCAADRMGWGCDTGRFLIAARRLGWLPNVVAYACKTVKCEEGALCSKFPRAR